MAPRIRSGTPEAGTPDLRLYRRPVDLSRPVVVFQDRIYLTAVCVDQLYTLGINSLIRVGVNSVKVVKRFRKISIEQSEKIDSVDK